MTIVAAAISPLDGIWLGSDGREVWGDLISSESICKWSVSPCGNWAISHSGVSGYLDVVSCAFRSPDFKCPTTYDRAGVLEFLSALRTAIHGVPHGPSPQRDDGEPFSTWGWAPIIATPLGLWLPDSSMWALTGPMLGTFLAGGSGRALGLGAMHALYETGCRSARQLVTAAISAACRLTPDCGGECWIRRFPGEAVSPAVAEPCHRANGREAIAT